MDAVYLLRLVAMNGDAETFSNASGPQFDRMARPQTGKIPSDKPPTLRLLTLGGDEKPQFLTLGVREKMFRYRV